MSVNRPHLLFLYGPPAIGKLTLARALEQRLGYRVLHNHVTIDAVLAVFPFGSAGFDSAVERMRRDLLEAAARERVDLIYTMVFAPSDAAHVEFAANAYESVGGEVTFVRLTAPRDELLVRVAHESRLEHRKLTDATTLAHLLDRFDLYAEVEGRPSLVVDMHATSPDAAADFVVASLAQTRL